MKCPNCNEQLVAWCWLDDGTYKGVLCTNCNGRWHSAKFSQEIQSRVAAAIRDIEKEMFAECSFPKDAITQEQFEQLCHDEEAYCKYFGFNENG